MSFDKIRHRLVQGRPLVLDADVGASFRSRGLALDTPGALGLLLREREEEILSHYRAEVHSRVDVLSALTADTTPRALAEVGMQHRAARLTSRCVELAVEAAQESQKPLAIAGILGSDMVSPMGADRLHEELSEHADRIAAAGCELLIARGQGSRLGLMAAVTAAARTGLPIWAVVEAGEAGDLGQFGALDDLLAMLGDAGASVLLVEVADQQAGQVHLDGFSRSGSGAMAVGVLLAASPSSVRGFPDVAPDPKKWVQPALELTSRGARVVGGGAGTSEGHTAALAVALGMLHPSVPASR